MDYFENVKKNFGFGCMRLPLLKNGEVDLKAFTEMVDFFLENGFNYFDTAHGYLGGRSEIALKACLTDRYPREKYILTDKLTDNYFEREEDIRPFFEKQLKICGVEYFDFYLMHAQNAVYFEKYKRCRAYETAFALGDEGKIKHVGISFHDKAKVLDRILTEYPEVEAVQIQFNYVDYDDESIEFRLCYEVCRKHNKPIIVMEPVKGGTLVNLPERAKEVFSALGNGSPASYAIRFAASFEGIFMVLSGMSDMAQMRENVGYMREFVPLGDKEHAAIGQVRSIMIGSDAISCTACRYCVEGCPKKIDIPDLFACLHAKRRFEDWNSDWYYGVYTKNGGKAGDCIGCGKCEKVCPQRLEIRKHLKEVSEQFDKEN